MKRILPPAILLFACLAVLTVREGYRVGVNIPWPVPIVAPEKVTAAVIIEETADRPKLPANVLTVLNLAPKHGVKVFDKDVLDKERRKPTALAPFLDAAAGKTLPVLVRQRGTAYDAIPCPDSEAKLQEALK